MSATDFCLFFLSKAAKWRGIPETASEAKMRPRSDLFVGHCEGRSPEAIRRYFFAVASEARQSHEIASPDEKTRLAMTGERTKRQARRDPFCASLRGPEARSNLVVETTSEAKLRPRRDTLPCHCERSEAVSYSHGVREEIASPDEKTRLAMTCQGPPRGSPFPVTARSEATKQSQDQRKRDCFAGEETSSQ